jgi:hypothetical protein
VSIKKKSAIFSVPTGQKSERWEHDGEETYQTQAMPSVPYPITLQAKLALTVPLSFSALSLKAMHSYMTTV